MRRGRSQSTASILVDFEYTIRPQVSSRRAYCVWILYSSIHGHSVRSINAVKSRADFLLHCSAVLICTLSRSCYGLQICTAAEKIFRTQLIISGVYVAYRILSMLCAVIVTVGAIIEPGTHRLIHTCFIIGAVICFYYYVAAHPGAVFKLYGIVVFFIDFFIQDITLLCGFVICW